MRTELPKSFAMLNLRPIDPDDYLVLEDGRNVVVFWDRRGRHWFGQRS